MEVLMIGLAAFGVSITSPLLVVPLLRRLGSFDVPNHRSLHRLPVLRGAGIATTLGMLAGWGAAEVLDRVTSAVGAAFGAALLIACIGLVEDLRGLSVPARLIGQLLVGMGVGVSSGVAGNTWWLVPVMAVAFAGYVNAANFMDGVDSISALHGAVAGGYFLLLGVLERAPWLQIAGVVCAAAFVGFLPWNVAARLRVFLGDVGSYLLGGLVAGCAALAVACRVGFLLATAPLLVYVADTAFTLVLRAARGERLTESHCTHVYQRLASGGWTHLASGVAVSIATSLCCLAALLSSWTAISTATAVGCVAAVLAGYLALPRVAVGRGTRRVLS